MLSSFLFAAIFSCGTLCAEGTWSFSSWTDGFQPADDNLILDALPSASSGLSNSEGGKNVAILTDGFAAPKDLGATQCLGNNASLTWSFASPVSIREVRVYSTWGDTGRSELNVGSVVTDGTNTIGGATGAINASTANAGALTPETGDYLATGVSSVTLNFGKQKNNYDGYAEIEVIGIVGLPDDYLAIVWQSKPDLPPYSGHFSVEGNPSPSPDAEYEWRLDGVVVGSGATLDHLFSEPGSYSLSVSVADGGITRTATRTIVVYGSVVYVDAQCATSAYPFGSRATAARNVADAIVPFTHANELSLYPGQYTTPVTLALQNGKKITGVGAPSEIVLSTSTKGQIVRASGAGSEIQNVTLLNGYSSLGGCLQLTGGARAANCRFFGGTCPRTSYGGCLYVDGADTIVSNCVIGNVRIGTDGQTSNNPIYYGLGLYLKNGLVTHCVITNVQTHGIHRALNHSQGAAVQIAGGTLRNCLVAHNLVTDGKEGSDRRFAAGVYQTGGTVENCTITDNSAQSGPAGYCRGGAGTLVNGIVWGNTNSDAEGLYGDWDVSGDKAALSHCCTNNPLFRQDGPYPYCLTADSPCVNAGLALPWISRTGTDLAGNPRLTGHNVDLGCYELALFPTFLFIR